MWTEQSSVWFFHTLFHKVGRDRTTGQNRKLSELTLDDEEGDSVGLEASAEMDIFALGIEFAEPTEFFVLLRDDAVIVLVLSVLLWQQVTSSENKSFANGVEELQRSARKFCSFSMVTRNERVFRGSWRKKAIARSRENT